MRHWGIVLLAGLASQLSTTAFASVVYQKIALTGDSAPAIAGASFATLPTVPTIDNRGDVAYRATVSGSGINQTNRTTLWDQTPQGLVLLGRQSSTAPGIASPITYLDFNVPTLNNSGTIAFRGTLQQAGGDNLGIWAGPPATVGLIAREGQTSGGNEIAREFALPSLNAAGQMAFTGLSGGQVWLTSQVGTPTLVVQQGGALDGAPSGFSFDSSIHLKLNDNNMLAFDADLRDAKSNVLHGIWSNQDGSIQEIAIQNGHAPGEAQSTSFALLFLDDMNNGNGVVLRARLQGSDPGLTGNNDEGIWEGTSQTLHRIVREGQPAPRTSSAFRVFGGTVINTHGAIAFDAFISQTPTSAGVEGVWTGLPDHLISIAQAGDRPPGTPAGVTFGASGSLSSMVPDPPTINEAGQVAFIAFVLGSGITDANNAGIWATTPQGVLEYIAREGDLFDVDPSSGVDFRTIKSLSMFTGSGGEDGYYRSLNDSGVLAFELQFTDGTSGIFTALIPEPTSIGTLLLMSPLLLSRRRRSLGRQA